MRGTVSLPAWLAVLLALLAAWAALDRLLLPGARWFFRRRVNRVLEELNTRLRIHIPAFKLTKRQVLIDRLLYDPQVQEAAEAEAREHDMPREVAMAGWSDTRARSSRPSTPTSTSASATGSARSIARSLYRVRLGYSDEPGLAAIAPDATVVFVMNHRSNMDYVLVSLPRGRAGGALVRGRRMGAHLAAAALIRAMGAYFVRRNSHDASTATCSSATSAMATEAGVTQAVFPEGGLSRDGRCARRSSGMLDYMLRGFDPAGERDIVFVPLGINYDRTFEDRSFLPRDADAPSDGARRRALEHGRVSPGATCA